MAFEREMVLVYLADEGRILRLDAEGNLLTVAGSGRGFSDGNGAEARFAEPAGLALDTTGTLIVADTANSLIREVLPEAAVRGDSLAVTTLAGTGERGTTDGPGQTAQFSQPRGVAVLSSSAILVADSGNHVLRKVVRPPVVEDFTRTGPPRRKRSGSKAGSLTDADPATTRWTSRVKPVDGLRRQ